MNGGDRRETGVASDDWARYGGARSKAGRSDRDELLADDPFAEYRFENGQHRADIERVGRRSVRTKSNLIGALVAVAILGSAAAFINLATTRSAPLPPVPRPTASSSSSVPTVAPRPTLRMAHVAVTIALPIPVFIPDRGVTPDDGTTIYLAGNSGAFPVNAGDGTVGTVWGGRGFPTGLRRLAYDRGLWVSSWPPDFAVCGPPCWDQASTYRIDPATGSVTLRLPNTYLVGAAYDGVYVASAGRLRVVDPTDGHELSSLTWKAAGEPRLGCDSIWSFEPGAGTTLKLINPASGDAIGGSTLDPKYSYGPVSVEGLCWMMSGRDGSTAGTTSLVWLYPNGSIAGERQFGDSMVILNGEFWLLFDDGTIQRFEAASSSLGYGHRFKLPITPPDNDPRWIFSSVDSMWLYSGNELVGFDIRTGSANAGN